MNISVPLNLNESELILACINRENWAQKKVYEDFHSQMLAVCLRYANSNDEAMDILHEGFLKVFNNIKSYEAGTLLGAWIRRIMVNTAIDYYRKEKRRFTYDLEEARTMTMNHVNPIHKMTVEEVMKAVQKLTPIYRAVFNLYVIEGFSHKEISQQLGITESTSRSNLVKARTKLKVFLKDYE
ncbi:MAG: RNA polymerase sigma factor [Bacteroidota bacterium]|nr:RNA polymerase sigma factor [Bacteroidota bacterium]